jgi:hypothetical protein
MRIPVYRIARNSGPRKGHSVAWRHRRRLAPALELLEHRLVLSTWTVTSAADSGSGSLRATLAEAGNGDKITFASSLRGQTITLTSGQLTVTTSVDIVGLGRNELTISGDNTSRVFAVASGATAAIDRLTITNGLADQGGGIDNAGILSISECLLAGNEALGDSAATGLGGGIFNEPGASLTVIASAFTNNQFIGESGLGFGGGVMNLGNASVTSTSFTDNTATGGTIGYGAGGAISNQIGAVMTISSSTFTGNLAFSGLGIDAIGGAIDNDNGIVATNPGGTMTITNSTFTGNQAIDTAFFAAGGAIISTFSTITITGSLFANNEASSPAFAESGAFDNEVGPATVSDCTFMANEALGSAAGAGAGGGALSNIEGQETLTRCTIVGSQCVGANGGDGVTTFSQANGGGVQNDSGSLTLIKCTVANNLARGGSNGNNNPDSAVGSAFGGGVFSLSVLTGTATLTVSGSKFVGNQAISGTSATGVGPQASGGGIDNDVNSIMTVTNSTIVGNTALGGAAGAPGFAGGLALGGGIADQTNSSATVSGCVLSGNAAIGGVGGAGATGGDGVGGGIVVGHPFFLIPDSSSLTLTNSMVTGNLAQGGAGGSGANGGDGLGGGIMAGLVGQASTVSLTVSGSAVAANVAAGGSGGANANGGNGDGGGMDLASGTACLQYSSIVGNLAVGGIAGSGGTPGEGIGGGLYIASLAVADALDTLIFANLASTSNDDLFGTLGTTC